MNKVIVIGAGASGMLAALTAAEDSSNRVMLLERQQRAGKKLMATGNGRCNLTNTCAGLENYHGEAPEFVLPALKRFPPEAAVAFFESLGLVTTEEYGGRVYPLSQSANSVVDVLRFALEAKSVELVAPCCAKAVARKGAGFEVSTDSGSFRADRLIVACGGAAGAKLGGVNDGYELLRQLGHHRTNIYPALVQVRTEPDYPRALKGVRADAKVTLVAKKRVVAEAKGELQFTDNGISGPAAFDISRAVSTGGEGLSVRIDFLREYEEPEVLKMLAARRSAFPARSAQELFTGSVHNRLGKMLVRYSGIDMNGPIGELSDGELKTAARSIKDFSLEVRGTGGFDSAQVTAGGVRTDEFSPETLESRLNPGLFVCGELLDIDGDCGGYNLQWAWASGRLAGSLGK